MPLSWLVRVGNLYPNLLLPFLLIVSILSSQAISFQIFLHALFPRFPWLTLLPFPSYFNFLNLTYLRTDDHKTAESFEWSYPESSQQCPPYYEERQSTTYQPVLPHTSSRSYNAAPHATLSHLQQNVSMFHNSTKKLVYRNIDKSFLVASKTNPASQLTNHNSLNFFHALPILALTASDAPPQQLNISPG